MTRRGPLTVGLCHRRGWRGGTGDGRSQASASPRSSSADCAGLSANARSCSKHAGMAWRGRPGFPGTLPRWRRPGARHRARGTWSKPQHRQRPDPGGGVRPAAERQDLHGHRAAVAADPGEQASCPSMTSAAADLLVQRRLPDDQVDVRLALAEDRLLPGQHRRDGAVPCVAVGKGRVGFGQFPRIGRGLQQRRGSAAARRPRSSWRTPRGSGSPARRPAAHRRSRGASRTRSRGAARAVRIFCCSSPMPYSASSSRSSLPRMPRWPVSILLIFERSHSRIRAASSSV